MKLDLSSALDGLYPAVFTVSGQKVRAFIPVGEAPILINAFSLPKPSSVMLQPGDPPEIVAAIKKLDVAFSAMLDDYWAEFEVIAEGR